MRIRPAHDRDFEDVLRVERDAFGGGDVEAGLVEALLGDATASPAISLVAEEGGRVVGHVLLTRARIERIGERASGESAPEEPLLLLLAPLAVAPEAQSQGVGSALVRWSLEAARQAGAVAVFVLGHVGYYPRFGFEPAARRGLAAPYPIPDEVADAWMVAELAPGALGELAGTVRAAETLMRPEYWRE